MTCRLESQGRGGEQLKRHGRSCGERMDREHEQYKGLCFCVESCIIFLSR